MRRGHIGGLLGLASLMALALLTALSLSASAADETVVQFEGRVLWIAGATLLVATDDSHSISVDLTYVPQDEYQRLERYELVVVTGNLSYGGNRIVGTSIESLESP